MSTRAVLTLTAIAVLGLLGLVRCGPSAQEQSVATTGIDAATIFTQNCATCHGTAGEGVHGVSLPLAGNSYVTGDPKKVIRTVVHGMSGVITVGGRNYNGGMPAFRHTLSNAQIAAIVTYVRTSWGNKASAVTEQQVARVVGGEPAEIGGSAPPTGPGAIVYAANCAICHGVNGEGTPRAFPPFRKNSFVTGDPQQVINAVLGGLSGPVTVNGKMYNGSGAQTVGSMPPFKGKLTNAQIADVITFIRTSWGNSASPVTQDQVAATK